MSDQGPGVEPQYHERVFKLFQRLPSEKEGTGVGLATVSTIMERHGGRAWIESEPGEGAAFWLSFPEHAPTDVPGLRSTSETGVR